jgi:spore coat polysaccharide biosynthesis protein SpsF
MAVNSPVICITARMQSKRLPGKVLADIHGKPMLLRLIERLSGTGYRIVVCTTTKHQDQPIIDLCVLHGFDWLRGDEVDVMQRLIMAGKSCGVKSIVRVTGDNPLTCPEMLVKLVKAHEINDNDYTYTTGQPMGTRCEVVNIPALERLRESTVEILREDMTPALHQMPKKQCVLCGCFAPNLRLTVDYPDDLERIRQIYGAFGDKIPPLHQLIELCQRER